MFLGSLCLIAAVIVAATTTGSAAWRAVLVAAAITMSIALALDRLGAFGFPRG